MQPFRALKTNQINSMQQKAEVETHVRFVVFVAFAGESVTTADPSEAVLGTENPMLTATEVILKFPIFCPSYWIVFMHA